MEATVDSELIGTKREAGLPNITGSSGNGLRTSNGGSTTTSGAFSYQALSVPYNPGAYADIKGAQGLNFDASKSNSIYGKSTTVQPKSILAYVWKRVE